MISNDTDNDNDKDVQHVSASTCDEDEDEDGDEDIVMKLKFSELSIQTEQLFTDIMKEEKEEEEETNSSSSRRRSNSRASLSLVGGDGASARRSSIISLRPSIMSKETAQKVIDVLLEVENADQEINCNECEDDGISLNNDEQEWDNLSLEQKINKLKCAAAGGGLVLLGIITTPTPFPTLPFIAAGFHVLANEFEQAKEAEEMLFEKMDIAKTAVIEKYEKFSCLPPSTPEPNLNMNKNSTEFVKSSNEFSNLYATIPPIKDDNGLE